MPKFPSGVKVKSDFHELITDGRAHLSEAIYKEIWHLIIDCLGLINMYLHAKNYQNSLSGLKVIAILTDYGRTDEINMLIRGHSS